MDKGCLSTSGESDPYDDNNLSEKVILDLKPVISDIMYVLGDVKRPFADSVNLMDSILKNQMDILLIEAEKNMNLRKGREISHEDILFLLRRNKVKLKRLLEYLQFLDDLLQSESAIRPIPDDDFPNDKMPKKGGKRIKKSMKFLSIIQDLKEFTSLLWDKGIIDHQAQNRQERIDSMAQLMSAEEYRNYSEKKFAVFFCPDKTRFKQWLLQTDATKRDLTPLAVTIIYFLFYETVAEIVDQVVIIRSKKYVQSQTSPSKESYLVSNAIQTKNYGLPSQNIADRSRDDNKAGSSTFMDNNEGKNSAQDTSHEIYDEYAIIPEEIMDAQAYLQEPSPITKFFWGFTFADKRTTKLICLAEYDMFNK